MRKTIERDAHPSLGHLVLRLGLSALTLLSSSCSPAERATTTSLSVSVIVSESSDFVKGWAAAPAGRI